MPVPFRTTVSRFALPRVTAALFVVTVLAACSRPAAPDPERPPEPQAATNAELREAIQAPIDRARQAEADVQDAAEAQRAAIEAAGG